MMRRLGWRALPDAPSVIPRATLARRQFASVGRQAPLPVTSSKSPGQQTSYESAPALMSSDADYASFLEKANQDTGGGNVTTQSAFSTKAVDTEVPSALQNIDAYYTSDTDEPFEAVSLTWDKTSLPTAGEALRFASVIIVTVADHEIGHLRGLQGVGRP